MFTSSLRFVGVRNTRWSILSYSGALSTASSESRGPAAATCARRTYLLDTLPEQLEQRARYPRLLPRARGAVEQHVRKVSRRRLRA